MCVFGTNLNVSHAILEDLDKDVSLIDIGGFTAAAISKLIKYPLKIVMNIISWGLGVSAYMLNWVIEATLINLKDRIGPMTEASGSIGITWRVIRDLVNMSFIFLLVYEGILVIFGKGDAKKVIIGIITAALLINFSMFFTKVIIDASNIVAVSLYNGIIDSGSQTTSGDPSLTNAFMQPMRLSSIYNTKWLDFDPNNQTNEVAFILGSSIFMLTAIFVFLAIAVLFVIRYLTIIILLIISPIGFVFGAVPGLSSLSKKFWDTLWGQVIFAPLYMLMTWIALTLIGTKGFLADTTGDFATALTNPKGGIEIIINFVLIIGLLIATLTTSKKYATQGGIVTSGIVGKATAFAGGVVFGGTSLALRNTMGRYYSGKANDEELKAKAEAGDKGAIRELKRAQYFSKASYDVRNIDPLKKQLKERMDLDFGKGNRGFKQVVDDKKKDRAKKDEEFLKSLKPSDLETEEAREARDARFASEEEKKEKEAHLANLDKNIKSEKDRLGITELETERKVLERELANQENSRKDQGKKIQTLNEELQRLNDEYNRTKSREDQIRLEEKKKEIKTEEVALKTLTDSLNARREDLDKLNKEIKEKSSDKKLRALDDKKTYDSKYWVSQTFRDLASKSGGYTIKDGDKVIERIDSSYEKMVSGYANALEKPGYFRSLISSTPSKKDRERAVAIRKITKSDKNKDLEKAMKAYLKQSGVKLEDEEGGGGGEDKTKKTESEPQNTGGENKTT